MGSDNSLLDLKVTVTITVSNLWSFAVSTISPLTQHYSSSSLEPTTRSDKPQNTGSVQVIRLTISQSTVELEIVLSLCVKEGR